MNDWHAMSIGESLSTVRQLIRGSLLVVGISVFVIGIVSIRVPAAEQLFPVETIVGTLGSDYTVLAMLGLLAVCFSVIVVVATHRRGIAESDPPAVEATPTAPAPGHSLDVEPGQLFGHGDTHHRTVYTSGSELPQSPQRRTHKTARRRFLASMSLLVSGLMTM